MLGRYRAVGCLKGSGMRKEFRFVGGYHTVRINKDDLDGVEFWLIYCYRAGDLTL